MIHVLVSFDANYMQHTQVMLYSLCKHTKESVEVWLLNLKLTDNNVLPVSALYKESAEQN